MFLDSFPLYSDIHRRFSLPCRNFSGFPGFVGTLWGRTLVRPLDCQDVTWWFASVVIFIAVRRRTHPRCVPAIGRLSVYWGVFTSCKKRADISRGIYRLFSLSVSGCRLLSNGGVSSGSSFSVCRFCNGSVGVSCGSFSVSGVHNFSGFSGYGLRLSSGVALVASYESYRSDNSERKNNLLHFSQDLNNKTIFFAIKNVAKLGLIFDTPNFFLKKICLLYYF